MGRNCNNDKELDSAKDNTLDNALDCVFSAKLTQAEAGRKFWLDSSLDEFDYILLLPHDDDELNGRILKKLESKISVMAICPNIMILSNKKYDGIGIDKGNNKINCNSKSMNINNSNYKLKYECTKMQISIETINSILALICLYKFTNKLIIGSFKQPYGRKIYNLLEAGVLAENDLIDIILSTVNNSA